MISTVVVPRVAVAEAENETVTVQVGLHGLFVKVAVTPGGRPDALKVTSAAVPLSRSTLINEEGLVRPCTTFRLLGEGVVRLKSKMGDVIVTVAEVESYGPLFGGLAVKPSTLIV